MTHRGPFQSLPFCDSVRCLHPARRARAADGHRRSPSSRAEVAVSDGQIKTKRKANWRTHLTPVPPAPAPPRVPPRPPRERPAAATAAAQRGAGLLPRPVAAWAMQAPPSQGAGPSPAAEGTGGHLGALRPRFDFRCPFATRLRGWRGSRATGRGPGAGEEPQTHAQRGQAAASTHGHSSTERFQTASLNCIQHLTQDSYATLDGNI